MKNKTIYVVTSGSYSDYRIEGVFDSEENAQLLSNKVSDSQIEEYTLNKDVDKYKKGFSKWYVRICGNGDVLEATEYDTGGDYSGKGDSIVQSYAHATVKQRPYLLVLCWARDKAHAIKIAGDRKTQALVNGSLVSNN